MQNLSLDNKLILYGALNLAFCVGLLAAASIGGGNLSRAPYVMLLFALCSSPLPFTGRLNGTFAMLGVAMLGYFIEFGLLDAVTMMSAPKHLNVSEEMLDGGEVIILIGALMKILGFHTGARLTGKRRDRNPPKDWSPTLLLPMGLLLWTIGSLAGLYQNLVVQLDNSNAAIVAGFTKLGVWKVSGLLLVGNYAGPLGIIILAYWWALSNRRSGNVLMLVIIGVQFCIGWVVDTKEVALSAPIVMLLTRFVVLGKVPTRWLLYSVLGIALVFPVLTAKRLITTEGLHLTRAQALPRTFEILSRAFLERDEAQKGKYAQKSQNFLERATDKGAVELFVERVGTSQPYKMGSTLVPLLYVFVPRIIWSDKPGENSSQTFNRDFHLSEDPDTHISPTHIGEWYWNFGFPGMVAGMFFGGFLLGFVCARFDPSTGTSMTRTLVIIVTLYQMVGGSGGQIELTYVVWLRVMVLIGLLHLIFAADSRRSFGAAAAATNRAGNAPEVSEAVRFTNLMR